MELNLPKTQAYNFRNRASFERMVTRFGVNAKSLPKPHEDMPEKDRYTFHMKNITGHADCPICHGPQKRYKGEWGTLAPPIGCMDYPFHRIAVGMTVMALRKAVRKSELVLPPKEIIRAGEKVQVTFDWHWIEVIEDVPQTEETIKFISDYLAVRLGSVCEHNHFFQDCTVCKSRALRKDWITSIEPVAQSEGILVGEPFLVAQGD